MLRNCRGTLNTPPHTCGELEDYRPFAAHPPILCKPQGMSTPSNGKRRASSEGSQAARRSQKTLAVGPKHRPEEAQWDGCENGVLKLVRVENFKNHHNFELEMGPHVNMIFGMNGSGKSSVLAAIIAALGGNPNKFSGTAGGSKAGGGLIMEGKDYAKVELHLVNRGPDAYAPNTHDEGLGDIVLTHELQPLTVPIP